MEFHEQNYTLDDSLWNCGRAWAELCGAISHCDNRHGEVKATLYLPDAKSGYYRGTRFDWSGMVGSLEYAGHSYYGKWFDRVDPKIYDFSFVDPEIVTNPCNSVTGVPEEFVSNSVALGWNEAKVGGTFIKIGVGVLRKPDERPYSNFRLYEIVDGGKWTVLRTSSSVEFIQELSDPTSGYGYAYRKRVSLTSRQASNGSRTRSSQYRQALHSDQCLRPQLHGYGQSSTEPGFGHQTRIPGTASAAGEYEPGGIYAAIRSPLPAR